MTIAVLLASYNRKTHTLNCLGRLFAQDLSKSVALTVFLSDDASADGTAEAVRSAFPEVRVLTGTGALFWAGGMRYAWRTAMGEKAFDFYLLLNDDTLLYPEALNTLLQTVEQFPAPGICIGSTIDESSGRLSYGGRRLLSPITMQDKMISGNLVPAPCDLGNGNIMLVPAAVVASIGILSDRYTHGLADWDYTLRAKEMGIVSFVVPGVLGSCPANAGSKWTLRGTPLRERLRHLYHHKGIAYREYLYFLRSHFPRTYYTGAAKLWIRTLFPFFWN